MDMSNAATVFVASFVLCFAVLGFVVGTIIAVREGFRLRRRIKRQRRRERHYAQYRDILPQVTAESLSKGRQRGSLSRLIRLPSEDEDRTVMGPFDLDKAA